MVMTIWHRHNRKAERKKEPVMTSTQKTGHRTGKQGQNMMACQQKGAGTRQAEYPEAETHNEEGPEGKDEAHKGNSGRARTHRALRNKKPRRWGREKPDKDARKSKERD